MSNESMITVGAGGTGFIGTDATNFFRAATLHSALGLLKAGITPTRGFTLTKGLKMVTQYTQKPYKRTEVDKARADLKLWIDAMRAALPVVTR
jgi:hypothetical protein